MSSKATTTALILSFALLASTALQAGTKTWAGGASGLWHVAGNWSPSGIPASSDSVIITNGAVSYNPGGDLTRDAGTTLTIGAGGSLVQITGGAWIKLSGDLIVDGGVFDTGSSTGFQLYTGGRVVVRGGSAQFSTYIAGGGGTLRVEGGDVYLTSYIGDDIIVQCLGGTLHKTSTFVARATTLLSGGNLTLTGGEFQYSVPVTISGGVITTPLIAAQAGTPKLTLSGGQVIVTAGTAHDGFYQNGSYIDFAAASTAMLTFTLEPAETTNVVYSMYFNGIPPKVRYDGNTVDVDDFRIIFNMAESAYVSHGVDISLKQVASAQATFLNAACTLSSLTTTSAVFSATVDTIGSPAATVYACYGTANGLLVFGNWQNRVNLGAAVSGSTYTYEATLNANKLYYYRIAATNSVGTTFATPAPSSFMTGEVSVESPSSIAENSPTPLSIVVSRPSANNCKDVALSVPFAVGGTATPGTHYTLSTTSPAKIPVSASSVTVLLTPKADWASATERTVTFSAGTSPSYLLASSNSVSILLRDAVLPSAPTNAFLGAVSESSANAANWSLGVVPDATHIIVFSPEYAQRELDWVAGTTSVVAGWMQPYAFPKADYRALFHTTPAAPLTITGDCVLNGGYWVHEGPVATPTTAVAVNIGGNLTVGAGAQINAGNGGVNQPNGMARGYYLAGPGYLPSAGNAGTGSSYGGEGATNDVTYGSVLNPMSYGSSGRGDNMYFSGAGLIVLNVAGTTTLGGSILANGFGYTGSGRGGSTGGSINLTTARLLGGGSLQAIGGWDGGYGSGSGGRIRVKLTGATAAFSDFTGSMTARGNPGNTGTPGSAAGTITRQTAADTALSATVIVDNNAYGDSTNTPSRAMCTHLPPRTQTDASFTDTSWVLRNYASVRLTRDTWIKALTVEGTTPRLFTENYTVTTRDFVVNGVAARAGTYRAADYPALLRQRRRDRPGTGHSRHPALAPTATTGRAGASGPRSEACAVACRSRRGEPAACRRRRAPPRSAQRGCPPPQADPTCSSRHPPCSPTRRSA